MLIASSIAKRIPPLLLVPKTLNPKLLQPLVNPVVAVLSIHILAYGISTRDQYYPGTTLASCVGKSFMRSVPRGAFESVEPYFTAGFSPLVKPSAYSVIR